MRTSFYFVLWVLVYLIIDVSGIAVLQQNSFLFAIAAVFIISYLLNKSMLPELQMQRKRALATVVENLYRHDFAAVRRRARRRLILDSASFIYMAVATGCLVIARVDWLLIIIFGYFAFACGVRANRSLKFYRSTLDDATLEAERARYAEYIEARNQGMTPEAIAGLLPKPSGREKALRIVNIVFAIAAIVMGLAMAGINLLVLLKYGTQAVGAIINLSWAALALMFGITDLISLASGYADDF